MFAVRYIDKLAEEGPCNIDIVSSDSLTQDKFIDVYAYKKPLIISYEKQWNEVSRSH